MALSGMTNFRNDWKTQALSKEIGINYANRGYSWAEKVQIVLNDFREIGIKSLKQLNENIIKEYVENLKDGEINPHTAQTYISALNTVIDYTNHILDRNIENISAVEHGISREIYYSNKAISQEIHTSFQNFLSQQQDPRAENLKFAVELQNQFGLRFRESAGLNINTIQEGLETGKLHLDRTDWTKNAREREISIRTEYQRELLQNISNFLKESNIINLAGAQDTKSFKEIAEFRSFADNVRNEFNKEFNQNFHFHQERHAWAQNLYSQLWQEKTEVEIKAPIQYYSEQLEKAGWTSDSGQKFYDAVKEYSIPSWYDYAEKVLEDKLTISEIKEIDKEIRMQISEELGHSRLDVTNVYLGHP